MKLFDIVDGNVVINAEELAIPAFKKIYDSDKSKTKDEAFKKISFIIFMYKWDSPYMSTIGEMERERIIKQELFNDEKWKPDVLVTEAIKRYKEFQHTFSLQFLENNMIGAKKLMDYYELVNWDDMDKNGKPVFSSRDLAANLEKAGAILRSLDMLKEKVRKEELESNKIRGGNEIGSYEDGHALKSFQYK